MNHEEFIAVVSTADGITTVSVLTTPKLFQLPTMERLRSLSPDELEWLILSQREAGLRLVDKESITFIISLAFKDKALALVEKVMDDFEIMDELPNYYCDWFIRALSEPNPMSEKIEILNFILKEAEYPWKINRLQSLNDDAHQWVMVRA